MQAFKTESVNSKGLQECSKISLIKLPASNHAKLRTFTPRGFLKCFPGCELQLPAATAHTHCQAAPPQRSFSPGQLRCCQSSFTSGKERRCLFRCAICDPEKVLAGSEELRDE